MLKLRQKYTSFRDRVVTRGLTDYSGGPSWIVSRTSIPLTNKDQVVNNWDAILSIVRHFVPYVLYLIKVTWKSSYSVFHHFRQAKFANSGSILGLSWFLPLPQKNKACFNSSQNRLKNKNFASSTKTGKLTVLCPLPVVNETTWCNQRLMSYLANCDHISI